MDQNEGKTGIMVRVKGSKKGKMDQNEVKMEQRKSKMNRHEDKMDHNEGKNRSK